MPVSYMHNLLCLSKITRTGSFVLWPKKKKKEKKHFCFVAQTLELGTNNGKDAGLIPRECMSQMYKYNRPVVLYRKKCVFWITMLTIYFNKNKNKKISFSLMQCKKILIYYYNCKLFDKHGSIYCISFSVCWFQMTFLFCPPVSVVSV